MLGGRRPPSKCTYYLYKQSTLTMRQEQCESFGFVMHHPIWHITELSYEWPCSPELLMNGVRFGINGSSVAYYSSWSKVPNINKILQIILFKYYYWSLIILDKLRRLCQIDYLGIFCINHPPEVW